MVTFRYEVKLFGEKAFFESVELNKISELKYSVKNNFYKFDILEKKVNNLEKKFNEMNQVLLEIKANIQNNQGQINSQNNQPFMISQQFLYFFIQNMYHFYENGMVIIPGSIQIKF